MNILLTGLILLTVAFFLHLLIWKIYLPKKQTKALLLIFFGTLASGLGFIVYNPGVITFESPWQYLHVALFFIAFTLSYIITYSAFEADSPSLVIVNLIHAAGENGMPDDELKKYLTDDILVHPRILDLYRDQLIFDEKGKILLTPKGKRFVKVFIFHRWLLNAKKGG
jgi:hypothetical protein